jgi:hypothetical protein
MKRGSEAFRWEARDAKPDVPPLQQALGAWVRGGVGRRQSDDMKRGSEAFLWEAREPKLDVEPLQHALLGAWVRGGAGR